MEKGYYFTDEATKKLIAEVRSMTPPPVKIGTTPLTESDTQIIKFICQGKSNSEIADLLFLSPRTIEGRKSTIYRKTETKNRGDLIIYAIKNGIYSVD